jgi:hypothetical protein
MFPCRRRIDVLNRFLSAQGVLNACGQGQEYRRAGGADQEYVYFIGDIPNCLPTNSRTIDKPKPGSVVISKVWEFVNH